MMADNIEGKLKNIGTENAGFVRNFLREAQGVGSDYSFLMNCINSIPAEGIERAAVLACEHLKSRSMANADYTARMDYLRSLFSNIQKAYSQQNQH